MKKCYLCENKVSNNFGIFLRKMFKIYLVYKRNTVPFSNSNNLTLRNFNELNSDYSSNTSNEVDESSENEEEPSFANSQNDVESNSSGNDPEDKILANDNMQPSTSRMAYENVTNYNNNN